jgi:aspartate/methionine/tyrosine aminotransferase
MEDAMAVAKMSAIRLAKRLEEVGFSDIVQVRNKVMDLRAAGQKVFAFHGGEPFADTPDVVKQALFEATAQGKTKYAPSSGIDLLRKALAEKLRAKNHLHVTPDDVIVTMGGAQALYASFQAVLDPGCDVLLFSPYWTPIRDMITGAQARPLFVPTAAARRSGITKALEQLTTPNTRAIYYNTPQNPSGVVFSRAEAEEVAAFAIKHDLIVFADEAYEDLVYDGEHVSIASLPGMAQRTISSYTFSKSYAMTGWRIGYAVAHEPFMNGLKKMVLYGTNGVPTMVQWAALQALSLGESYLQTQREEYRKRRDVLVAGLNAIGLECEMPAGAFYAFPRVAKIHKDSRKASALLLDRAHVATIPGVVFGAQGEGHVRFGYSTTMETIEEGLESLRKAF